MGRFTNNLDNVTVAAPCPADWDAMIGNNQVRFCGQCQLNVYNLSSISRREAESLISRTEGRLCVRFYRRRDGSIITRDCPVGLRRLKLRAARIKRAVASSVIGFLAGIGFNGAVNRFGDFCLGLNARGAYGQGVVADPKQPAEINQLENGRLLPAVGRLEMVAGDAVISPGKRSRRR